MAKTRYPNVYLPKQNARLALNVGQASPDGHQDHRLPVTLCYVLFYNLDKLIVTKLKRNLLGNTLQDTFGVEAYRTLSEIRQHKETYFFGLYG